jgi:uncharacterized protein YjiS (DUF1127 family)
MTTISAISRPIDLSRRQWQSWPNLARIALRTVASWRARARQRSALAQLDDHLLRDIGVTRLQARQEASRPFWQ